MYDIDTGWWRVGFDITLEGKEIGFSELNIVTKDHILRCLSEGYVQGQIVEEDCGETSLGWWNVKFEITLEGKEIQFIDLSSVSQEHILHCIQEGCMQGEVIEDSEELNDDEIIEESSCDLCGRDCAKTLGPCSNIRTERIRKILYCHEDCKGAGSAGRQPDCCD